MFFEVLKVLGGLKRSGRSFRFISSYFRPCTSPWFRVMSISVIEGHDYLSHDYLHVSVGLFLKGQMEANNFNRTQQ